MRHVRNGELISRAILSVTERGEWLGKQLGLYCQQPQMPSQEAWTLVNGDPQKHFVGPDESGI